MESEKRRSHKKLCSSSISQVILDTREILAYEGLFLFEKDKKMWVKLYPHEKNS